MKEVTVNKQELLTILRQNRADHRAIFEEALDGFARTAERLLQQRLDLLRAGQRRTVQVILPVPEDHTTDYDRAIKMVEMSVGDTLTLAERDFAQYVMDDWGWQREFISNSYGSTRASGKFGSSRYLDGDEDS
jgi:hypothetical protein